MKQQSIHEVFTALKACGIKVEYGEQVEAGQYRGSFKTVGDEEHAKIIELYVSGLGMDKVGPRWKEAVRRSTTT